MLSLTFSTDLFGLDASVARVEASTSAGTPVLTIFGLPDRALSEARERVRAAIFNSGFAYPAGHVLVNLSPRDVHRREASWFDLSIALALLAIDDQVDRLALQQFVAIGELALDGTLRPVRGVLSTVSAARDAGFSKVIVPLKNADEAALVDGVEIYAAASLQEALNVIAGRGDEYRQRSSCVPFAAEDEFVHGDFADVRGQLVAKRVLEIAAAGGHNVLMIGPPGTGKTMLARRLTSILPQLTEHEARELTKIYSVAGLLGSRSGLVNSRPFRFPHFTISETALGGGGPRVRPGEVSLASGGVLFLDDLPEFGRSKLDLVRHAIESESVTIARADGTCKYPANFQLVAAMNPCECGYRGVRNAECRCDDAAIANYVDKLSGALMDHFDLQVTLARVPFDEMVSRNGAERSATIRQRVSAARAFAKERLQRAGVATNAKIAPHQMREHCALDQATMTLLSIASSKRQFSARALDRIARVARTIADLAGSATIRSEHVAEAIQYRSADLLGAPVG